MKLASQSYELVRVERLLPHPENPRKGDVDAIGKSVEANGFYGAVVAQRSSGHILAGNHRFLAAKASGGAEVPVIWVDCDDKTARRILLADNRTNDLASYNDEALSALLESVKADSDWDGTGFVETDLNELLEEIAGPGGPAIDDDFDGVIPKTSDTKPGQMFVLGDHRLLCGDSTVAADVALVMNGETADMVWTDPPYGVSYVGKTKDALTLDNDSLNEPALRAFLTDAFTLALDVCKPGGAWYVAAPAGPLHWTFADCLMKLGVYRAAIIWVKDVFVLGHGDYHYRHEPVFYGWKPGGRHYFVKDRTQDSVWEIPRPKRSEDHPTMKPVELVARALRNSSKIGGVAFDPFGGSGTTIIAAEQTGRKARVIEKSPVYCDVIVRRWEALTSRTAERLPLSPEPTAGPA